MKSIFFGQIKRKYYYYSSYSIEVVEFSELVKFEKLHECNIDKPILTKNENVYIPELDITFEIIDITKSVDDSVIYRTSHIIQTIEDDKSIESFKSAKNEMENNKNKIKTKEFEMETERIEAETERIKIEKMENTETKTELCFKEPDGMSRAISSNIIAYMSNFNHYDDLKLIDMKTKNIIGLDVKTRENLFKFLEYNKLSKNK